MLTTLVLGLTLAAAQIPDFGGKEQAEQMKKLNFLVGDWKGAGKYIVPGREVDIESTERVEWGAGGTCLLVIGKHWMKGPNDQRLLIHDAAAMIRYDLPTKLFMMRAQLANGMGNEFDVEVQDKGFVWGIKTETAGSTRYTMKVTDAGEWNEVGERSTDGGKTWTKFMEMTLSKAK